MKLRNKIFVLIMAIVTLFSATGCATIKDGSRITTAVMTLRFYRADGTSSTSTVKLELYENNAPKTVAHIKKLINDKYYDGVCVNNIANHFIEIGEYQYTDVADMKITKGFEKKAYDVNKYGTLKGEFHDNGVTGQKLSSGKGAILMKHDRVQTSAEVDEFDTATSGLIFITNNTDDFNKNKYCVVGKMVETDGDPSLEDTTASVDQIDRSKLSSFAIINSIHSYNVKSTNDISTTTYYQASTQKWFELVTGNGEQTVYEITSGTRVELTDSEQDLFINNVQNTISTVGFKDEYYDYFKIPYQKIVVDTIRISK